MPGQDVPALAPGAPGPPAVRRGLSAKARSDLASIAGLLGALLAIMSALTPWWFLSVTGPGTSSTVTFYPGSAVSTVTNGGGGTTSYDAIHIPSVGALYAGVLGGAVVLALFAAGAAVHGFASARGRWTSARARRLARSALSGALLVSLLLGIAVPVSQPALYQHDNPSNACSSATPPVACSSFWGKTAQGGATTTWGAGFGWWADVVAAGLLAVALVLAVATAAPAPVAVPPATPRPRGEEAPKPSSPLSVADLHRLAELKRLSDSGEVPLSTFQEAKQRLLDAAPEAGGAGPGPRAPLPSQELSLLKGLHDAGALTDEEYERLERRALLWI